MGPVLLTFLILTNGQVEKKLNGRILLIVEAGNLSCEGLQNLHISLSKTIYQLTSIIDIYQMRLLSLQMRFTESLSKQLNSHHPKETTFHLHEIPQLIK